VDRAGKKAGKNAKKKMRKKLSGEKKRKRRVLTQDAWGLIYYIFLDT